MFDKEEDPLGAFGHSATVRHGCATNGRRGSLHLSSRVRVLIFVATWYVTCCTWVHVPCLEAKIEADVGNFQALTAKV
jgi:hypothetical protein